MFSGAAVCAGTVSAGLSGSEGFAGSGSRSCRLGAWFGLADAGFFPSVCSCGVSFSSSAGGCVDAVSSTDSGAVCSSWLLAVCAAASVFPICSAWKADSSETSEALWDLPAHPARFARSMPQRSTDRILFFFHRPFNTTIPAILKKSTPNQKFLQKATCSAPSPGLPPRRPPRLHPAPGPLPASVHRLLTPCHTARFGPVR